MCMPRLLPTHSSTVWRDDMGTLIDMIGMKFARLTVVSRADNIETRAAWNCVCECGSRIVVDGKKLRSSHTKSCGCYRVEVSAPMQGRKNIKHGMSRTAEYHRFHSRLRELAEIRQRPSWADMKKIREIYFNRPAGHHVDHVIPLRGRLVCGLHVENNLQYLSAAENMKKHNTFKGA